MEVQKVDIFIATNQNKFPQEKIPFLREKLLQCDENQWNQLSIIQLKDPTTALILSLFLGWCGVDRFYIGNTGLGVGKLSYFIASSLFVFIINVIIGIITAGIGLGVSWIALPICNIWQFIDFFLIMQATRNENVRRFNSII